MNTEEAQKAYDELEETGKDIPCVVSTSLIQGEGMITNAEKFADVILFSVTINDRNIKVPCYGIMKK